MLKALKVKFQQHVISELKLKNKYNKKLDFLRCQENPLIFLISVQRQYKFSIFIFRLQPQLNSDSTKNSNSQQRVSESSFNNENNQFIGTLALLTLGNYHNNSILLFYLAQENLPLSYQFSALQVSPFSFIQFN